MANVIDRSDYNSNYLNLYSVLFLGSDHFQEGRKLERSK